MKKHKGVLRKKSVFLLMTAAVFISLTAEFGTIQSQAAVLHNPRRDLNGTVTYDCVYFGNYPQSDVTGNTSEPIKWRVLSVTGNDVFLVADKNLEVNQYHDTYLPPYKAEPYVLWEECTLRSWLNGYGSSANYSKKDYTTDNFMDRAFSSAEQQAILTTNLSNQDNPAYGTEGGNNTSDKIFLLSYEDITNPSYGFAEDLEADKARERQNTAYVAAGGMLQSGYMEAEGCTDEWYLRSPGASRPFAVNISMDGSVNIKGNFKSSIRDRVCPALHLNLQYLTCYTYAGTVSCANIRPVKYYTVKYVLNGGTNGENPTTYSEYAAKNISLKAPKRAGYSFAGWYTEKTYKNKVTAIKVSQKKNITLYAKWTKVKKPSKTVIKSAVNKKGGRVRLSFQKVKGANGYEIQYSTNQKFKKSVTNLTVKGTTKTLNSLKKSKIYYIRVRAYKTDSVGKKIYGSYSNVKKVKVKK